MDEHYVWDQTADDGRFRCTVAATADGYQGTLVVTEEASSAEILREDVGIAYGARFGPDVSDVQTWQDKAITAIDAWLFEQRKKEEP